MQNRYLLDKTVLLLWHRVKSIVFSSFVSSQAFIERAAGWFKAESETLICAGVMQIHPWDSVLL